MTSPRRTPINEDDVLTAFALRFDGYKYQKDSAFEFRLPGPSDPPTDLDSLSTRGRYLEIKYRDEGGDRP